MSAILRRYGLATYWLICALFTLRQARYPGLMLYPEDWRYPWKAVFVVWVLLAVLIGILHAILRPASYHYSWWRLLGALVYSALLFTMGIFTVVTDMPGYYYVPAMFSAVNLAIVLLFACSQGALWFFRRGRNAA